MLGRDITQEKKEKKSKWKGETLKYLKKDPIL